jgi:hypothetical protein
VLAGDSISVSAEAANANSSYAQIGFRSIAGSKCASLQLHLAGQVGSRTSGADGCEYLYNANVELLAPRIAALDVKVGSISGGTSVTITGDHLAVAKSVQFGDRAATISSAGNNSITVITPAGVKSGEVPVSVVTAGGASPSSEAAKFVYGDATTPRITKLKFSRKRFTASNLGGPVASAKIGSTVSFTLNKATKVNFTLATIGKHGKAKALPKKRGFSFEGKLGKNKFIFSGRPGKKPLAVGRYQLSAQAVDLFGRKSKTSRVSFRIDK